MSIPFNAKDHAFIEKKKEESGNVTYLYDEKHIAARNKGKEKRLKKLSKSLKKMRAKVKEDLSHEDEKIRLAALAVALIDETYERVGNEESASDLHHYGVTGWLLKHITFGKGKATIKYVGKAGVKQNKEVKTKSVLSALKRACEGKKENDRALDGISAKDVNAYLVPFSITAKDIRGYHANKEMLRSLKANGKGKLPKDGKEREKALKERFKDALEDAAKKVGHEPGTLKRQYLIPRIEQYYMEGKGTGSILAALDIPLSKRADEEGPPSPHDAAAILKDMGLELGLPESFRNPLLIYRWIAAHAPDKEPLARKLAIMSGAPQGSLEGDSLEGVSLQEMFPRPQGTWTSSPFTGPKSVMYVTKLGSRDGPFIEAHIGARLGKGKDLLFFVLYCGNPMNILPYETMGKHGYHFFKLTTMGADEDKKFAEYRKDIEGSVIGLVDAWHDEVEFLNNLDFSGRLGRIEEKQSSAKFIPLSKRAGTFEPPPVFTEALQKLLVQHYASLVAESDVPEDVRRAAAKFAKAAKNPAHVEMDLTGWKYLDLLPPRMREQREEYLGHWMAPLPPIEVRIRVAPNKGMSYTGQWIRRDLVLDFVIPESWLKLADMDEFASQVRRVLLLARHEATHVGQTILDDARLFGHGQAGTPSHKHRIPGSGPTGLVPAKKAPKTGLPAEELEKVDENYFVVPHHLRDVEFHARMNDVLTMLVSKLGDMPPGERPEGLKRLLSQSPYLGKLRADNPGRWREAIRLLVPTVMANPVMRIACWMPLSRRAAERIVIDLHGGMQQDPWTRDEQGRMVDWNPRKGQMFDERLKGLVVRATTWPDIDGTLSGAFIAKPDGRVFLNVLWDPKTQKSEYGTPDWHQYVPLANITLPPGVVITWDPGKTAALTVPISRRAKRRPEVSEEYIWIWDDGIRHGKGAGMPGLRIMRNVADGNELKGIDHVSLAGELGMSAEDAHRAPRGFVTIPFHGRPQVTTYGEPFARLLNTHPEAYNAVERKFDLMPGQYDQAMIPVPRGSFRELMELEPRREKSFAAPR